MQFVGLPHDTSFSAHSPGGPEQTPALVQVCQLRPFHDSGKSTDWLVAMPLMTMHSDRLAHDGVVTAKAGLATARQAEPFHCRRPPD